MKWLIGILFAAGLAMTGLKGWRSVTRVLVS